MLFAYTYVPHTMEKMQAFIDFIFFEVWCKSPGNGDFRLELFDSNLELSEVMKSFYYSDKKNADFFYGSIEKIYHHFSKLNAKHIRILKWWYLSNNNIERLCRNDSGCHITLYSDLERKFPTLAQDINKFFTGLYGFDAAALKEKVGDIDEHYKAFMNVNTTGKCPFCGIGDIKGFYHTKREAYDHYLPMVLYPFNTINFRNLVPACHECNSTYKNQKDPAHNATRRRKIFYPYATDGQRIEITIDLGIPDIDRLTPAEIELSFGPDNIHEEIETWTEVYGIEERYKAKCCSESDGKYWLTQVIDEWQEGERTPAEYLQTLNRLSATNPFADSNFLKKAFLDGCQRA
ncbi:MAG: hypothetical protein ABIE92_05075, partial [bacterium]